MGGRGPRHVRPRGGGPQRVCCLGVRTPGQAAIPALNTLAGGLQWRVDVRCCVCQPATYPRAGTAIPSRSPCRRFQARGPFWGRQYLFWHADKPLTLIYEVFSTELQQFLGSPRQAEP